MAHTKFILTSNEVMPVAERAKIMAQLSAFHEEYGMDLTAEVLEPSDTVKIVNDSDPMNPRVDHDNIGVMYCEHRRYTLGDKDAPDPRQIDKDDIAASAPLYLYDHSGLTISHGAFSCQWDSGQVGMHYITKKAAVENFGKDWTEKQLQACLEGELETYDAYLRGDVWGYIIEDEDGNETESCWGFYGDTLEKTGILEHIDIELHEQARKAWEDRFDA